MLIRDLNPSANTAGLNAIVVGTGRSGSTMLSNLLREHPAILSLSEFFRLLNPAVLTGGTGILDAAQFWELIGTPALHLSLFLQQEVPLPEFLYPFKASSSRFSSTTSVPPILLVTLPHLTNDYESLYDELQLVVRDFPPDLLEGHFARLFHWLKQRFGRSVCVERSGLSLTIASSLIAMFPRTKFVHLIRDGRDCAWSMSRHFAFRFMIGMQVPLETSPQDQQSNTQTNASPEGTQQREPINFAQVLARPIPLAEFGKFWSSVIIMGVQALSVLPEEQLLTMRYEDFVADPQTNLARLIDFIDPSLHDTDWLARASKLVEPRPSPWASLPPEEREALERACQPGQAVLDLVLQEGMHSPKLQALLRF